MTNIVEWFRTQLGRHQPTQSAKHAEERLNEAERAIDDAKKQLNPYLHSPDPLQAFIEDLHNRRQMEKRDD